MNEDGEYFDKQGRITPVRSEAKKLTSSWAEVWAWAPGVLALDAIMLAEPFGVLRLLPNTKQYGEPVGWKSVWRHRLETFLPTYKATRVIVEVVAESTPQSLLQAYIFVRVMTGVGVDQLAEHVAIMEEAAILPISIAISALNLLKVWAELLLGARTAGVPVQAWLLQIWEMGAGKLPLDAIRRGTIEELNWRDRPMAEVEWIVLVDALLQNTSLVMVDLQNCHITDEQIASLADALGKGALPSVTHINLQSNQIGDQGMAAFAGCLGKGALSSLKKVVVDNEHVRHPQLVAACEPRGIVIE